MGATMDVFFFFFFPPNGFQVSTPRAPEALARRVGYFLWILYGRVALESPGGHVPQISEETVRATAAEN